jgi:hypothetical protein
MPSWDPGIQRARQKSDCLAIQPTLIKRGSNTVVRFIEDLLEATQSLNLATEIGRESRPFNR